VSGSLVTKNKNCVIIIMNSKVGASNNNKVLDIILLELAHPREKSNLQSLLIQTAKGRSLSRIFESLEQQLNLC